MQKQAGAAYRGCVWGAGGSADRRRISFVKGKVSVIAGGEIRGNAEDGRDLVDHVLSDQDRWVSEELFASVAAGELVAQFVNYRIENGLVHVLEAGGWRDDQVDRCAGRDGV